MNYFQKNLMVKGLAGAAGLLAFQMPALSAGDSLMLEEVTVTATKRETSLQDTAIAVTAFTSDMMEELDINSAADMEALVPSFTTQQNPNRISIRGVGRFDNSMGTSPGIATYNDGIYFAEDSSLYANPINVERTEILRGPQGTLFGRNTTGGAVNIITKKPTAEFKGDVRVKLGNYGYQRIDALVSGPINENIRYKLYVSDQQRDGLQKNLAGPDARTQDNSYAEGQIEWDISENLTLWAKYSGTDYSYIPGANNEEDAYDCINNWSGLGPSIAFLQCQAGGESNAAIGDPQTIALNTPGRISLDNSAASSIKLTYEMAESTLSYLYGAVKYDWDQKGTDYDGTPYQDSGVRLSVGQYQDQESHELQLTSQWDKSWNYIVGLYYFEDRNEQPYNIYSEGNPAFDTIYNAETNEYWENPEHVIYYQNGIIENESWAAYGEVGIDLNDQWAVTVGLRYSDDSFHGTEVQLQYYDMALYSYWPIWTPYASDASQGAFVGDSSRYTDSVDAEYDQDYTNTTGKITIDYRPIEDHLVWFTVANGYKMGGVKLGNLEKYYNESIGSDGLFDQEDMLMLELGWKAELLDHRMRTEVVLFDYKYDDMQRTRSFQSPPPASITLSEVVNVDTEMRGLEISTTYLLTANLRAIYAFSYNESEIVEDIYFRSSTYSARDENNEIIADNVKGNSLVLTPKNKHALSLHYMLPTDIGEFSIGGSYSHVGKRYFDFGNNNSEDSYKRLDLQASWTSAEGTYKVLAAVNNATDEEMYNTYGCLAAANGTYGTDSFVVRCSGNPMDQRMYNVQFMAKF